MTIAFAAEGGLRVLQGMACSSSTHGEEKSSEGPCVWTTQVLCHIRSFSTVDVTWASEQPEVRTRRDDQVDVKNVVKEPIIIMLAAIFEPLAWHVVDVDYSIFV